MLVNFQSSFFVIFIVFILSKRNSVFFTSKLTNAQSNRMANKDISLTEDQIRDLYNFDDEVNAKNKTIFPNE